MGIAKRNTSVLGKKLEAALANPLPSKKRSSAIPAAELTPVESPVRISVLAGIKVGQSITVQYPPERGRVPGHYVGDVVTVSKEGADMAAKLYLANGKTRAVSFKTNGSQKILDALDDREVLLRPATQLDLSILRKRRLAEGMASGAVTELEIGLMVALIYPHPGPEDEWTAGVVIGAVSRDPSKKDPTWGVQLYFPEYYDDEEMDPEPEARLEETDGRFKDLDLSCTLALIRAATPGETRRFNLDRETLKNLKKGK